MKRTGNNLEMTRGDSEYFYTGIEGVPFVDGVDTVTFTIRTDTETKTNILQKVITEFTSDGLAHVIIDPVDTSKLAYGAYVYDCQVTRDEAAEHPYVKTYIKPARFTLTGETTHD